MPVSERSDVLIATIDQITGYFLDQCPDGVAWEDFDSTLDGVRTFLQVEYDVEQQLISVSKPL